MLKELKEKKYFYQSVLALFIIFVGLIIYFVFFDSPGNFLKIFKNDGIKAKKQIIVEEKLSIPDTKNVAGIDGKIVSNDSPKIPLIPEETEEYVVEYVVPMAKVTVKGGYDIVKPTAEKWAKDAKLIFIKSLGAVDLGGKSSQWQILFGSKEKKKGYEIIIREDKIISEKEAASGIFGYDLPNNWYDSEEAIKSIQNLPQFSGHTISALNFFYNFDAKEWRYALGTSFGNTSMRVR